MSSSEERKETITNEVKKRKRDAEEKKEEGEDETFVVTPAPKGYSFTGLPRKGSKDYVQEIRQMLMEGGDPDGWKEGKKYTKKKCLSFSNDEVVQMYGRLYHKCPPLTSELGTLTAQALETGMKTMSRRSEGMHDPVMCIPLFKVVRRIKMWSESKRFGSALGEVEGLLLALSGGADNGMDRWKYTEDDSGTIANETASLIMVAISHVFTGFGTRPDPATPKGMCFDSALARACDIDCPGDEPKAFVKHKKLIEELARSRKKSSMVLILSDGDDLEMNNEKCTLAELKKEFSRYEKEFIQTG